MIHFRQITTLLIVLKLWFCLIPRRTRAMVPFPACPPYLQKVTKVADLISDFAFLSVTKSVKSQIKNPFLDSPKGTQPLYLNIWIKYYYYDSNSQSDKSLLCCGDVNFKVIRYFKLFQITLTVRLVPRPWCINRKDEVNK